MSWAFKKCLQFSFIVFLDSSSAIFAGRSFKRMPCRVKMLKTPMKIKTAIKIQYKTRYNGTELMTDEMKFGRYRESVKEMVKPKPTSGAIKAIYKMMGTESQFRNF